MGKRNDYRKQKTIMGNRKRLQETENDYRKQKTIIGNRKRLWETENDYGKQKTIMGNIAITKRKNHFEK